jgi:murein hydrolase activator
LVRKCTRGSKISGLTVALLLFSVAVAAGKDDAALKSVSHYDSEIKKSTKQLEEIRKEIEAGREKVKELKKKEGNYLGQLQQLEKNISTSHAYLSMIDSRIDTVQIIIGQLSDSLEIAGKQLQSRQQIMRKRLRQAYMRGVSHPLLMVFTAESPLDAVNRVRYLEKLNRYDRDLVTQIENTHKAIDEKKDAQVREREHLSGLREEKQREQTELVAEEKQRKKMLKNIRAKKESFVAMVKELEASQKELARMIRLLEKKRKSARARVSRKRIASFEKGKGTLPWPVVGPVVTKFGKVVHPEYKTIIMSNGIDIGADKGETVRCVADGTVIHTGWMRGLGKMVIVDHVGGYLSIYAHLKEIVVVMDQEVKTDAVLGYVGETGSLGGAKLHFEIRKSAQALNPVDWLEKR